MIGIFISSFFLCVWSLCVPSSWFFMKCVTGILIEWSSVLSELNLMRGPPGYFVISRFPDFYSWNIILQHERHLCLSDALLKVCCGWWKEMTHSHTTYMNIQQEVAVHVGLNLQSLQEPKGYQLSVAEAGVWKQVFALFQVIRSYIRQH